jgi:hypothetical protein
MRICQLLLGLMLAGIAANSGATGIPTDVESRVRVDGGAFVTATLASPSISTSSDTSTSSLFEMFAGNGFTAIGSVSSTAGSAEAIYDVTYHPFDLFGGNIDIQASGSGGVASASFSDSVGNVMTFDDAQLHAGISFLGGYVVGRDYHLIMSLTGGPGSDASFTVFVNLPEPTQIAWIPLAGGLGLLLSRRALQNWK